MMANRRKSSSLTADLKITYSSPVKVEIMKAGNRNYLLHNSLTITTLTQKTKLSVSTYPKGLKLFF